MTRPASPQVSGQRPERGLGWYEDSGDEIYVNAKFVDGGGGVRQKNTNGVCGDF